MISSYNNICVIKKLRICFTIVLTQFFNWYKVVILSGDICINAFSFGFESPCFVRVLRDGCLLHHGLNICSDDRAILLHIDR